MTKLITLGLLMLACTHPAFAAKQYSYFRVGNANDVTTATTPGTVLMGGGTDVDAAFQWMCQRSGGGDFLVIRATGTDAYNPYIQSLCPGENSVATLIIPNATAANDPFVASTINNAEALWIAGGDQSNYINFWNGTVVGNSTAYFMQAPGAPEVCQPKTPLTYQNISVYRINSSGSFNLNHWTGKNGVAYTVSADAGVLSSTQPGGSPY